jgi:hypothetical protein
MNAEDIIRRMELISATSALFDELEECDSQIVNYTYEALIAGSVELEITKGDDHLCLM